MSWVSLALAAIQFGASLLDWAKKRSALAEAQDLEAARAGLKILALTQAGQRLREQIIDMEDHETESLWNEMVDGPSRTPAP